MTLDNRNQVVHRFESGFESEFDGFLFTSVILYSLCDCVMPRKCCAGECRSNYKGETEKIKVFSFPKDELKREAWRRALNCVLQENEITDYIGVCIKHWPEGFETFRKKGHDLPVHPPSIFATSPSYAGQSVSEDRQVNETES